MSIGSVDRPCFGSKTWHTGLHSPRGSWMTGKSRLAFSTKLRAGCPASPGAYVGGGSVDEAASPELPASSEGGGAAEGATAESDPAEGDPAEGDLAEGGEAADDDTPSDEPGEQ